MAMDLNGTVDNKDFDGINEFKRRNEGKPTVGEIIDIEGPDNRSAIR